MTTLQRLYDIALARFESGRLAEAEPLLIHILEQQPGNAFAMIRLAEIAIESQRYEQAVSLLSDATSLIPDNPEVLLHLGRAYVGQRRFEDGITCLERATLLTPNDARVHRYLADAFRVTRNLHRALETCDRAIALSPEDAEAHASKGHILLEMREMASALASYEQSLSIEPDNWQVYGNSGIALIYLGRLEGAKAALMFSNALYPMHPEVAIPLSGVLIDLGEHKDATVILKRLLAMMPKNEKVLLYAGINAFKQGHLKDAIRYYIQALVADETNVEIKMKLVEALRHEGKIENAITLLSEQINTDPTYLPAHVQKARSELLLKKLDQAAQTISGLGDQLVKEYTTPFWDGGDIQGKRILLYAQFGLESFNVLLRLVRGVKERGAVVYVECPEPLLALVGNLDFVDVAYKSGDAIPEYDVHASFEQLFGLLGLTAESVPADPVLSPPSEQISRFNTLFKDISKPKIGIMWRKETNLRPNFYHDIKLTQFSSIIENDAFQVLSLQTQCGLDELSAYENKQRVLHQNDIQNANLDERLACIANLDLFITTDTLTGQAAVAAGIPVWFLLGAVPDWHFGLDGDMSIWHPRARLFRQTKIGQWEDVVATIHDALKRQFD